MDDGGEPVPILFRSRQFENLLMAARQSPLFPAHPLAGGDVEVPAMHADVFTDVENDVIEAAFGHLTFETTERISIAAPMDFPRRLIEDLDATESGVLQLFQRLQRS